MKKLLSVTLFVLILFTCLPSIEAASESYVDVPESHPYYQEIMFLQSKGVINTSSRYGINEVVTREEVAVMVSKAIGLNGKQTSTKFKDVPSSLSSSGYINSAVNAGIINGYPDGTFKPKTLVTRGHMAAFISRGFKLTQDADIKFKDVPVGSTAYEHVSKLAYSNITTGYEDGSFKPNENLTRAHISVFIARAMGYGKELSSKELSTKEVVDLNDTKVVFIETNKGTGSGIVIASGLILTNYHVIEGTTEAKVTFSDGIQYDVSGIVESDANKDIAILKTTRKFQALGVSILPSSKSLSKGEKVVAIGSPIGLQNSVTEGIISSFRTIEGVSQIQTNADIDHGSSGGGLFDVRGRLIGMTSSGIDGVNANLNFAITTDEFVSMVNKYINQNFDKINANFPITQPPQSMPNTDQPVVLGNIALGMSKQQVKNVSGGYFFDETSNILRYSDVTVLGYLADVNYEFQSDKLIAINVFHHVVENQYDLNTLEAFFSVMYGEIEDAYGLEANIVDSNWYDDKEGYILSAYWVTIDFNTLLVVQIKSDASTYGGIRISMP